MLGEQNRLPNRYTQAAVYVDGHGHSDICGYIVHSVTERMWRFESMLEMIGIYENVLNETGFPQKTCEFRNIYKREKNDLEANRVDMGSINRSEKPTFIINIQYRQNASWQGTINWVEGGVTQHFRSTLELLKLMDEAIADREDVRWNSSQI